MPKETDPTGNAHYISRINKAKVVTLIRTRDTISRAEIAKKTRLSPPTVSRIVEDLKADGLVAEVGEGQSSGGRRPTLLRFSGEENYTIGIDLGTTNIYGILTDLNAHILAERKVPTRVETGFPSVMERTSEVIQELKDELGGREDRICGIGMAVAGLINRERRMVEFSPDFHWHNVDVAGEISKRHDIPVIFDNVTRVMAIGEMCHGIGKLSRSFIMVNVGYGIGAGIVIDRNPLYGPLGMAGEFGHITLDRQSRVQCDCGNFGCLEALASGNAIAKFARAELREGRDSILRDMARGGVSSVSAETVAEAAKQGDPLAREIFGQAVEYLGIGIAALVNLFTPETVLIGGGVAQAGDILFDKVRKVVNARALNKASRDVEILPATFGLKAAVMGAVSLIVNEVLTFTTLNHRLSSKRPA